MFSFDWSRYHTRHIALHIAYVGARYSGFTTTDLPELDARIDASLLEMSQRHAAVGGVEVSPSEHQHDDRFSLGNDHCVEAQLFFAAKKVKLIRDLASAAISRCGRTDKGVSALGQVISLRVRSNLTQGLGIMPPLVEPSSSDGKVWRCCRAEPVQRRASIKYACCESLARRVLANVPPEKGGRCSD